MKIASMWMMAGVLAWPALEAGAAERAQLVGEWCFYEQEAAGNKAAEKVDVALLQDGSYVWREGGFEQKGRWTLEQDKLQLTDVGTHTIVQVGASGMELRRGSTMRFKRERCGADVFCDQDILRFHNAASTGDMQALGASLASGIGIDIVDVRSGDTALIKAAKFCRVPAARELLARGANKAIKGDEEKTAGDYAASSRFHKGCDELVKALR